MKYIAYFTKGLENVVKSELQLRLEDFHLIELDSKRITFESNAEYQSLIDLKTIDDIGLFLYKAENVSSVTDILDAIDSLDVTHIRQVILQNREIVSNVFSLTISAIGTKNFTPQELVDNVSALISRKYNWHYTPLDHTNFDIRIFIDHKDAYISIRLTKESLHHRTYKTDSKPGSLKPTIAAAMVQLATNNKTGIKIVDDFCGSGTILCEGVLAGNDVYGGDIDAKSVSTTRNNLHNLGYVKEDHIKQLNATNTHWQSNYFDYAISNLPWDKQIEVASITDLYIGTLQEYARIVKQDGTVCLLVSKPDLLIKHAKKYFPNHKIDSYKLGLLGQTPTIVLIK